MQSYIILTPRSTFLLEKSPLPSYSINHLSSMEAEGSLPYSQQPTTGAYLGPNASNAHPLIYACISLLHVFLTSCKLFTLMLTTSPAHLILLDLILTIFGSVQITKVKVCSFLKPPFTSSFTVPNTSNHGVPYTPTPCCSLRVTDQVAHL